MAKRKVLIPLDGSDFSRQIVAQVRKLLPPAAYDLILMRVSEPPKGLTGMPPRVSSAGLPIPEYGSERDLELATHPIYQSQKMETATAALSDELQPDRQVLEADGYAVSVEVKFGDPAQLIVEYAAESGADLIAMTTHGRSGLERLMAGSVALHVMRMAPVPVLLYRPTSASGS